MIQLGSYQQNIQINIMKLAKPAMSSQNSNLLENIAKICAKCANTTRPLSLQQLTTVVAGILTIWDGCGNSQPRTKQNMAFQIQNLLKCTLPCKNDSQDQSEAEERLVLFTQLIQIIKKQEGNGMSSPTASRLIGFAMNILTPCLQSLKLKKIQQILAETCQASPSNKKAYLSSGLAVYFLELLRDRHYPKFYQILTDYSESVLQDKPVTDLEAYFTNIFKKLENQESLGMGVRVLSAILQAYVKKFEKHYVRTSRSLPLMFDSRVIGLLIKLIGDMRKSADLRKTDTDQHSQKQCNLCTEFCCPAETFLLEVNSSTYQLSICPPCSKSTQGNQNSITNILFHLAYNLDTIESSSQSKKQATDICEVCRVSAKIDDIIHCEHNKELKLVRSRVMSLLIFEGAFKEIWAKLWAMLMILSNHNDGGIRLKAVKVICQMSQYLQNYDPGHPMVKNVEKCLNNRLLDTDIKIRVLALTALIQIWPFTRDNHLLSTLFDCIRQQIAESSLSPNGVITSKHILDIMDRLHLLLKDKRVQQDWMDNPLAFMEWMKVMAELANSHQAALTRQNHRSSKSKKRRQLRFNAAYKLLQKYKVTINQCLKKYQKNDKNLQSLLRNIIICQDSACCNSKISQQSYTTLIEMVVNICGIDIEHSACRNIIQNACLTLQTVADWKQCSFKNIEQLRWVKNPIVVAWMMEVTSGQVIWKLIELAVTNVSDLDKCMMYLKIVSVLLQTIQPQQLNPLSESAVQNKGELQKLRQLIITELVPETNQLYNGVGNSQAIDEYMAVLTGMIGSIVHLIGDANNYTLTMYENCWKFAKEAFPELPSSTSTHQSTFLNRSSFVSTARIMLFMLPEIVKMQKSPHLQSNHSFNTHVTDILECLKLTIQQLSQNWVTCSLKNQGSISLLMECTKLLAKLWQMCPQFLTQCQQVIISIFSVPLPTPSSKQAASALLAPISAILATCECVSELQKIRDIIMYFLNLLDNHDFSILLQCRWFYVILGQLYRKGMVNLYSLNKLLIYGIVEEEANQQNIQIQAICHTLIAQISEDFHECRQLYSNFSQTIRFILLHKKQSNISLPLSEQLTLIVHSKILSKSQQSKNALKPTLLKSMCQHLNKLVLSGKFLNPAPENNLQILLICNSFVKCNQVSVNNFTAAIRCLMTVIDSVYFEVLQLIKRDNSKSDEIGNNLWLLMKSLHHFLNGVPFKKANQNVQDYFAAKDNMITLLGEKKLEEKAGYEGLEYLHDILICGIDSEEENGQQSEDQSTYDTSQNKEMSNCLNLKKTKPKVQIKPGRKEKRTKRPMARRNRTAPKSSLRHQFQEPQEPEDLSNQVAEYKKKLRSRKKLVV